MSITFNADEIFEMAEEIERNGAKFYRKAAENSSDVSVKKILLEMANMEDGHLEIFKTMRQELSEAEKQVSTYDPENQAVQYLDAMANSHGYEGKVSPEVELTGRESAKEIFEIALNSEKESVVFYFGLKSLGKSAAVREKIEGIILEELSHIATLLNKLKELED